MTIQVNLVWIYLINKKNIDILFFTVEKGKKWLHVMVTYICQGEHKYQKEVANVTFIRIPLPRVTKFRYWLSKY